MELSHQLLKILYIAKYIYSNVHSSFSEKQMKSLAKRNITYRKLAGISLIFLIILAYINFVFAFEYDENSISMKPRVLSYKASGEPVELINNKSAQDPTWDELMAFLKEDDTDRILYQSNVFDCVDYAERLHNNAEQAGIRAAYVSIDFYDLEKGHAINAFQTSDKGLTFIDCTGSQSALGELDSYDKVAYIEEGKEYGIVSIYYTETPDYQFYELRKDNPRLRGFFKSVGVVKSAQVYWEY